MRVFVCKNNETIVNLKKKGRERERNYLLNTHTKIQLQALL